MEHETLYAAAKWDMLKALEKSSKSPVELAERSNTSVSNVSQSLRFLELAGIVKSERVGNRDKGQPRVLYSIAGNSAYLIVTAKNFVEKKTVPLDETKKIILRVLFHPNESWQPYLLKAATDILENISSIKGAYIDNSQSSQITFLIIQEKSKKEQKELKEQTITFDGASRKIKFQAIEEAQVKKDPSKFYPIHDPLQLCGGENT